MDGQGNILTVEEGDAAVVEDEDVEEAEEEEEAAAEEEAEDAAVAQGEEDNAAAALASLAQVQMEDMGATEEDMEDTELNISKTCTAPMRLSRVMIRIMILLGIRNR